MESLIGFFIALAIGVTGVGGGTLTVPILVLALGLQPAAAVGTSLLFVTLVKITAAPVYFRRGQIDFNVLKRLVLGGVPGVWIGALALSKLRSTALEPLILTLVGSTIALLAIVSLYRTLWPSSAQRQEHKGMLVWCAFPIGLEVGFSAAGAGALGSLLLLHATRLKTASIVGTDLLFGLIISIIGGGLHLAQGNVDLPLVLKLVAGGIPGAFLGAYLGTRLPGTAVRAVLSVLLVLLGGDLCWRGLSILMPRF